MRSRSTKLSRKRRSTATDQALPLSEPKPWRQPPLRQDRPTPEELALVLRLSRDHEHLGIARSYRDVLAHWRARWPDLDPNEKPPVGP